MCFGTAGYHVELLTKPNGRELVDEGLKYVHNDTCYPALLGNRAADRAR